MAPIRFRAKQFGFRNALILVSFIVFNKKEFFSWVKEKVMFYSK